MMLLNAKADTGAVVIVREASNRFLVKLPYGRFGATTWINKTAEAAYLEAATYLAK